jgi:Protein of unknown function (DUF3153)
MKNIVGKNESIGFADHLLRLINRQLVVMLCAISIALSGCVKYDTGINFSSLNYGEIVEHIQLGEQLNSFSQNAVQTWIASIDQRTKQAEGKLERLTDREFQVTIPFHNTQELVTKIDRYFNPQPTNTEARSKFNSHLQINQNNFLLIVRNHLTYDIDLRALSLTEPLGTEIESTARQLAVSSASLVDIGFSLQSPWGVKNIDHPDSIIGVKNSNSQQMTWQLQPGKLNHIDAIFWLPNPLGIGTVLIILICIGGYYLKYRQSPLIINN